MNSATQDRSTKLAGNLATPGVETVDEFSARLEKAGVNLDRPELTTSKVTQVLAPARQVNQTLPTLNELLVSQRTRLSYIVDALGPNGKDILTDDGIMLIRAAELAQDRIENPNATLEDLESGSQHYAIFQRQIEKGLGGFDGIVGIVEAQKLEGGGRLVMFDLSDPRGAQLAATLNEYIQDWVDSGLGDPSLSTMSPLDQLASVADYPDALRLAYDLKHPDEIGKVTGKSLNFSLGDEFGPVKIQSVNHAQGQVSWRDHGQTPQITNNSGPLER